MPDEDDLAKAAEEWFNVDFWFELFQDALLWEYERAEHL